MAHEQHTSRFTNVIIGGGEGGGGGGGGGGIGCRITKKLKHKKVPQRGMGVAQLEKIISEDRQLKDAGVLKPNLSKLRRPTIPLPPPFPANRMILKPRLYNFDGENTNQNQNRYLIGMPANQGGFRYESGSSMWPQVHHSQRSQFPQLCSSSMVNVSLGTTSSSTTSSVMKIEPPSIQSFCVNKYPSFMQEGDKMVELKRSYPFSMENMPIPSFNCNTPSAYVTPTSKSDESSSCTNGGTCTTSLELNTPFCRENPSSLSSIRDLKTKKFMDENLNLAKDFLTLAPPQPSSHSRLTEKLPSYQGQTTDSSEPEWSNQQPLHSFFPAAKIEGSSNGKVGEHVDLSLKL